MDILALVCYTIITARDNRKEDHTMTINRSTLCRTANHLTTTGMSRSDAFKAAWLMAKRGGISKVAGVTMDNRQRLIERLTTYQPDEITVSLRRDKANIFDPNAIAVVATVESKGSAVIGYIPALAALKLARLMDVGITLKAMLAGIVGGYDGLSYGIRLRVAI